MSEWVTLTLRTDPVPGLTLDSVQPDRFAELATVEIAALTVRVGRDRAPLGDFFTIDGERSPRLRLEGTTSVIHGIGGAMRGGELVVEGDAGAWTGTRMAGGTLHVRGSVGSDAGTAMTGGLLRVDGNAGDRLGAALPGAAKGMTGGEIVVAGSAGDEAGARLRRGLIVVRGSVGRDAARATIAGSLVVLGSCGDAPGRGNKRGSIVVCGQVPVPPTYRYACTFRPPHLRLTLVYLRNQHGLTFDDRLLDAEFRRYCGDAGDPGKGEILQRVDGV